MNLLSLARQPLGKYIKNQRNRLGITQIKLAASMNVTPQFMGHIENGIIGCPEELLKMLIKKLNLKEPVVKKILYDVTDMKIKLLFS
jgi:transcriptional regulator with XRE-family HTH domain